jgi:glycerol-3-phosphate acyltransferase PlsY
VALTRYISLGSVLGSLAFVLALARVHPHGVRSPTFLFGLALAALVVVRHRDNLRRVVQGRERRFTWKREGRA